MYSFTCRHDAPVMKIKDVQFGVQRNFLALCWNSGSTVTDEFSHWWPQVAARGNCRWGLRDASSRYRGERHHADQQEVDGLRHDSGCFQSQRTPDDNTTEWMRTVVPAQQELLLKFWPVPLAAWPLTNATELKSWHGFLSALCSTTQ